MPEVSEDAARYTLYWTWDSAGMGCHAMLEDLGVNYCRQYIEFGAPWPEDYLVLNPHKKIPTLTDRSSDAGAQKSPVVVYQSAAILMYLADNHPDAGLVPAVGTADRAVCTQWMFFLAEMMMSSYLMYYYPDRHTADVDGADAVQQKAIDWIADLWGRLDSQLWDSSFLLGDHISVCDYYMLTFATWNVNGNDFKSLERHSNVIDWHHGMLERPAVATMLNNHSEH